MTTASMGELGSLSAGLGLLFATVYLLLRQAPLTVTHVVLAALGLILVFFPKLENFTFKGAGLEMSAEIAEAEANASQAQKRLESVEISLKNMEKRFELLVARADIGPGPFANRFTAGSEPRVQPSMEMLGPEIPPAHNPTLIDGKPRYDYSVVVLYKPEREFTGVTIDNFLSDKGYAVGSSMNELTAVTEKPPPQTVRIIYRENAAKAAQAIEADLTKLFAEKNIGLDIALRADAFPVKNGDVQLQLF